MLNRKRQCIHGDLQPEPSAIWQLDAHERSEPLTLVAGEYLRHARLSPDGEWLAYVAGELSDPEVYVQPYPELDRRFQVSDAGGIEPNWSPESDRLYYRSSSTIFAVDVTPASSQIFSKPRAWFEGPIVAGKGNHYSYDVASDGRLLVSLLDSRQLPTHLDLVEAWDQLLLERLGD